MGTGKGSLRDLLRKVDAGQTHLRAHEAAGTGGDGHGREHTSYLPTVRLKEDEGGSQQSSESKTTEVISSWSEIIESAIAMREKVEMEEENGRINSSSEPEFVGFLNKSKTYATEQQEKRGDPLFNFEKASLIASAFGDKKYTARDVALVMMAMSMAEASHGPNVPNRYESMVGATAYLAVVDDPF
jgi:hypothetical protein